MPPLFALARPRRVPQARMLLDAGASTCVEEPARRDPPALRIGGPRLPCSEQGAAFGRAQRDELFRLLDQHDIVGTLEAFDAHLLLLQDLSGWRTPDLAYVQNVPRYRFVPPHFHGAALPTSHPLVCANMSACIEAVRAVAPIDHELWERYGVGFEAAAAARLGGSAAMRSRLDELRRERGALSALAAAMRNASSSRAAALAISAQAASIGARAARAGRRAPPPQPVPTFSADLRARASQERYCHAGKVPFAIAPVRPHLAGAEAEAATHAPFGGPNGARMPPDYVNVLPQELVASVDRTVASVPPSGDTACMPVPAAIVQLTQANFVVQRPRAKHLPIAELHAPSWAWMTGMAWWAAAHPALMAAAGLPPVPPACAQMEESPGPHMRCPSAAESEQLRQAVAEAAGRAGPDDR